MPSNQWPKGARDARTGSRSIRPRSIGYRIWWPSMPNVVFRARTVDPDEKSARRNHRRRKRLPTSRRNHPPSRRLDRRTKPSQPIHLPTARPRGWYLRRGIMKPSSPRPGFTCSGSTGAGPPRPAALRRGPGLEPGGRTRRGTGTRPFASRAPEPPLVRGRKVLMGGPDEAGVRGRRSAVQPLRRPTPYRGRLLRWAEAARSP